MSKYHLIRHYFDGNPIDESCFNTTEELYNIPMIKEYMLKDGFQEIMWDSMYCMPSNGPHYSVFELVAKFIDGHFERICWINDAAELGLPTKPYEKSNQNLVNAPSLVSRKTE